MKLRESDMTGDGYRPPGNPQLMASIRSRIGWTVSAFLENDEGKIKGTLTDVLPGFLLITAARSGVVYVPVRRCIFLAFKEPTPAVRPRVRRSK